MGINEKSRNLCRPSRLTRDLADKLDLDPFGQPR
jgi:hypothetical protein